MLTYQYKNSHFQGKTVLRPSYLYNGNPYILKDSLTGPRSLSKLFAAWPQTCIISYHLIWTEMLQGAILQHIMVSVNDVSITWCACWYITQKTCVAEWLDLYRILWVYGFVKPMRIPVNWIYLTEYFPTSTVLLCFWVDAISHHHINLILENIGAFVLPLSTAVIAENWNLIHIWLWVAICWLDSVG